MAYGNGGEYLGGQTAYKDATPIRLAGVGNELEQQEKATQQLHSVIDQLFARLELILTPVPPQAINDQGTAPAGPPLSNVVRSLKAQGFRIDSATQRLTELLQRIEL